MPDQHRKNQLISARPQDLNQVLYSDCDGGGYKTDKLIVDNQQLTGRTTTISPVMTKQDNNN